MIGYISVYYYFSLLLERPTPAPVFTGLSFCSVSFTSLLVSLAEGEIVIRMHITIIILLRNLKVQSFPTLQPSRCNQNEYYIQAYPLSHYNYVRSGYINMGAHAVSYAAANGYGWSRQARAANTGAYNLLIFGEVSIDSSDHSNRHYAFRVLRR